MRPNTPAIKIATILCLDSILATIPPNCFNVDIWNRLIFKEFNQITKSCYGNNGDSELGSDFLCSGLFTLAAFLPVECNGHTASSCTGLLNPINGLANRCTGRYYIVGNENIAFQFGTDQGSALAMVLGLFAVVGEGDISLVTGVEHDSDA